MVQSGHGVSMKKKLFACIFLVLSWAALVAVEPPSPVPASNEDDILKIGVAGAHSGPLATYGLPPWQYLQTGVVMAPILPW